MAAQVNKRKGFWWVYTGLGLSLALGIIFMNLYGMFRNEVQNAIEDPLEGEENIDLLYRCNQILYYDLYNATHEDELSCMELYYPIEEEMQAVIEQVEALDADYLEEYEAYNGISNPLHPAAYYEQYEEFQEEYQNMQNYFTLLDHYFGSLSMGYDYAIRDNKTGKSISNLDNVDWLLTEGGTLNEYLFFIRFSYDEAGNASVVDVSWDGDAESVWRRAADQARTMRLPSDYANLLNVGEFRTDILRRFTDRTFLKDCEIAYGMTQQVWERILSGDLKLEKDGISVYATPMQQYYSYMIYSNADSYYLVFLALLCAAAFFLPKSIGPKPWETSALCRMPAEVLLALALLLVGSMEPMIRTMINVINDDWTPWLCWLLPFLSRGGVTNLLNLFFLTVLFFVAWYIGICLRYARDVKVIGYLKERSLVYRFFPFLKSRALQFYDKVVHLDLSKNVDKMLVRLVLANGVVLLVIALLWGFGIMVTILYSIFLYFILRKYLSDLQKKYKILLGATNEIALGNLNVSIDEDLGVFEPFKPQIYRIQEGFKKAVEEEVKSQRMKTELITNVSHDLKTPLTAIITYVSLLREKGITQKQREEYLDTLDRKSIRLKALIEDLFEVSKANSRNVQLNLVDVDIMNLLKQVELEMSDKLQEAELNMRMNLPNERVVLSLDSQKTYRIYENLFGNIAKYAMKGTRVYVSASVTPREVAITLKNIMAQELHMEASELVDRFVRGDDSRNTEGSGLGLAIAKSFTELQGGKFLLELDDDLFRVSTIWRREAPGAPQVKS